MQMNDSGNILAFTVKPLDNSNMSSSQRSVNDSIQPIDQTSNDADNPYVIVAVRGGRNQRPSRFYQRPVSSRGMYQRALVLPYANGSITPFKLAKSPTFFTYEGVEHTIQPVFVNTTNGRSVSVTDLSALIRFGYGRQDKINRSDSTDVGYDTPKDHYRNEGLIENIDTTKGWDITASGNELIGYNSDIFYRSYTNTLYDDCSYIRRNKPTVSLWNNVGNVHNVFENNPAPDWLQPKNVSFSWDRRHLDTNDVPISQQHFFTTGLIAIDASGDVYVNQDNAGAVYNSCSSQTQYAANLRQHLIIDKVNGRNSNDNFASSRSRSGFRTIPSQDPSYYRINRKVEYTNSLVDNNKYLFSLMSDHYATPYLYLNKAPYSTDDLTNSYTTYSKGNISFIVDPIDDKPYKISNFAVNSSGTLLALASCQSTDLGIVKVESRDDFTDGYHPSGLVMVFSRTPDAPLPTRNSLGQTSSDGIHELKFVGRGTHIDQNYGATLCLSGSGNILAVSSNPQWVKDDIPSPEFDPANTSYPSGNSVDVYDIGPLLGHLF